MIGTLEIILIIIAVIVVFYGKGRLKIVNKIGKVVNEIRKIRMWKDGINNKKDCNNKNNSILKNSEKLITIKITILKIEN